MASTSEKATSLSSSCCASAEIRDSTPSSAADQSPAAVDRVIGERPSNLTRPVESLPESPTVTSSAVAKGEVFLIFYQFMAKYFGNLKNYVIRKV